MKYSTAPQILVVSVDNTFIANSMQPEATSNKCWPHVDQNDHENRFPCSDWHVYQGVLYIWGSMGAHASTTVVWPDSHHNFYANYMGDAKVQRRLK